MCFLLSLQANAGVQGGTSMAPGRGTAVLQAISAAAQAAVNAQQQQYEQEQHAMNVQPVLSYQAQPPYLPHLPVQRPRVPLPEVRPALL
jgi:hypothetical protein